MVGIVLMAAAGSLMWLASWFYLSGLRLVGMAVVFTSIVMFLWAVDESANALESFGLWVRKRIGR